jgi:hypothetical protein
MLAVICLVLAFLAESSGSPALAADADDEEEVPPSRQAVIVLRAMAYDGNLKARARGAIDIGVVYKKGNARSEQTAALGKSIADAGIDMLYVCDGLGAERGAITEVTHRMKVLSVGKERQQVHQGLSLGVFQVDGRTTIVLNLQASRQEGVAFAADLLRLASVIR